MEIQKKAKDSIRKMYVIILLQKCSMRSRPAFGPGTPASLHPVMA